MVASDGGSNRSRSSWAPAFTPRQSRVVLEGGHYQSEDAWRCRAGAWCGPLASCMPSMSSPIARAYELLSAPVPSSRMSSKELPNRDRESSDIPGITELRAMRAPVEAASVWEISNARGRLAPIRFGSLPEIAIHWTLRFLAVADLVFFPFVACFDSMYPLRRNCVVWAVDVCIQCVFVLGFASRLFTSFVHSGDNTECAQLENIHASVLRRPSFLCDVVAALSAPFLYARGKISLLAVLRFLKCWRIPQNKRRVMLLHHGGGVITRRLAEIVISFFVLAHLFGCLWFTLKTLTPPHRFTADDWSVDTFDGEGRAGEVLTSGLAESLQRAYCFAFRDSAYMLAGWAGPGAFTNLQLFLVGALAQFSVFLLAYVQGVLVVTVSMATQDTDGWAQQTAQLSAACEDMRLGDDLTRRICQYHSYITLHHQNDGAQELLDQMSVNLVSEMRVHRMREVITSDLFRGLPPRLIFLLLSTCVDVIFSPSDMVVRQGEIGDCMYIVLRGSVSVLIDEDATIVVKTLYEHSVFGEISLIRSQMVRSAWIRADCFVMLTRMDKDGFDDVLDCHPDLKFQIIKRIMKWCGNYQFTKEDKQILMRLKRACSEAGIGGLGESEYAVTEPEGQSETEAQSEIFDPHADLDETTPLTSCRGHGELPFSKTAQHGTLQALLLSREDSSGGLSVASSSNLCIDEDDGAQESPMGPLKRLVSGESSSSVALDHHEESYAGSSTKGRSTMALGSSHAQMLRPVRRGSVAGGGSIGIPSGGLGRRGSLSGGGLLPGLPPAQIRRPSALNANVIGLHRLAEDTGLTDVPMSFVVKSSGPSVRDNSRESKIDGEGTAKRRLADLELVASRLEAAAVRLGSVQAVGEQSHSSPLSAQVRSEQTVIVPLPSEGGARTEAHAVQLDALAMQLGRVEVLVSRLEPRQQQLIAQQASSASQLQRLEAQHRELKAQLETSVEARLRFFEAGQQRLLAQLEGQQDYLGRMQQKIVSSIVLHGRPPSTRAGGRDGATEEEQTSGVKAVSGLQLEALSGALSKQAEDLQLALSSGLEHLSAGQAQLLNAQTAQGAAADALLSRLEGGQPELFGTMYSGNSSLEGHLQRLEASQLGFSEQMRDLATSVDSMAAVRGQDDRDPESPRPKFSAQLEGQLEARLAAQLASIESLCRAQADSLCSSIDEKLDNLHAAHGRQVEELVEEASRQQGSALLRQSDAVRGAFFEVLDRLEPILRVVPLTPSHDPAPEAAPLTLNSWRSLGRPPSIGEPGSAALLETAPDAAATSPALAERWTAGRPASRTL